MPKKRMIKDKKIRDFLKNEGRNNAKRDFFELLKRIAKPAEKS